MIFWGANDFFFKSSAQGLEKREFDLGERSELTYSSVAKSTIYWLRWLFWGVMMPTV